MGFALRWRNKLRRRFYKPFNRLIYGGHYFVCDYFGADFLVRSVNVGGLEISAKIGEYSELKYFTRACAELKPDVFVDIGANLGLYTCIVMKNGLAPRAILFAPLLGRAHETVLEVLSRLLGILLAAVGVQLFIDGLTLLGALHSGH